MRMYIWKAFASILGEQKKHTYITDKTRRAGGGRGAKHRVIHFGLFLSSTYNMSIIGSDCANWRIWWDPKNEPNLGPLCRVFQLLNPFQAVHFWDICWFGRTPAAARGGRWLLVGQRNVIGNMTTGSVNLLSSECYDTMTIECRKYLSFQPNSKGGTKEGSAYTGHRFLEFELKKKKENESKSAKIEKST